MYIYLNICINIHFKNIDQVYLLYKWILLYILILYKYSIFVEFQNLFLHSSLYDKRIYKYIIIRA